MLILKNYYSNSKRTMTIKTYERSKLWLIWSLKLVHRYLLNGTLITIHLAKYRPTVVKLEVVGSYLTPPGINGIQNIPSYDVVKP